MSKLMLKTLKSYLGSLYFKGRTLNIIPFNKNQIYLVEIIHQKGIATLV